MARSELTIERLRQALDYDPETGVFRWKISTSNRAPAGAVSGTDNGVGYIRITIDGRRYYAHRLAWFWVHGEMPTHEIDHADGVRSNNAIRNLRHATHAENGQNQKLRSTNSSGKAGVSWSKRHGKWVAYIWSLGKKRHLGLFDCAEQASRAYLAAKARLHDFQPVPRYLMNA